MDDFDLDNIPEDDYSRNKILADRGTADFTVESNQAGDGYDLIFDIKTNSFNLKFTLDFETTYYQIQELMDIINQGVNPKED